MARWGDEKTIYFISLYRQRECLWNPRSPLYRNKAARDHAYKSILQTLNDKQVDIKGVKTKIKNLRSMYHTELKKMKDTSRCSSDGSGYWPSVPWFKHVHAFLADSLEDRSDGSSTTAASLNNELDDHDTSADISAGPSSQDTDVYHIKLEATLEPNLDPLAEDSSTQPAVDADADSNTCTITPNPSSSDTQFVKPKRRVFRRNRPRVDNTVLSALQRLENRVCSAVRASVSHDDRPAGAQRPREECEDEFHMFAMSVAAQLRQLPLHVAVTTQTKIQSTLSEARLASIFSNTPAAPTSTIKIEDLSD